MACRMSPDDIRTLAKKHDWTYNDTYKHLGGHFGTIVSIYKDGLDTAGTPFRVRIYICHDTGMVTTCMDYQEREMLGDEYAVSIAQLEDLMINLRKQVANHKQEMETLLGDMEVTDQDGNKEKEDHSMEENKDIKINYQEISQEIKRNTNKAAEELYGESKERPEFLTEQYGDPCDGEKVSQPTGRYGQDSESEEEQNREPGELGTSLPDMDPSLVTSLSQPQPNQPAVMPPPW